MKRWLLVALLVLGALILTACDSSATIDGKDVECAGVLEKKDTAYVYRIDKSNVVVGAVFSETVVVPAVIVFDELWCPVRKADTGDGA